MTHIFDSHHEAIPRLRSDLELLPVEVDGKELMLLRDPNGYSTEELILQPEAQYLFFLFNGTDSIATLRRAIQEETGQDLATDILLQLVQALDRYYFLENARFAARRDAVDAEYATLDTREAAHAGSSYPSDAEELTDFLQELFDADSSAVGDTAPVGVITPHIDLQIGPQVYVPAFRRLQTADVDTVVILGTSHYSYEDLFLLTEKHFATPLGTMQTDREFVQALRQHSGDVFTHRDVAHKREHSIEFPVLFLQHLFGNDRVHILPVLCTSFEEFLVEGTRAAADAKYSAFINGFREAAAELGRRVAFIMSVDWSHVGRKFRHDFDAAEVLETVRESDFQHFNALEACDYDRFYTLLRESKNATQIDGFACITTFFDLMQPRSGCLLDYQLWHEEERASAVSFASMAFYGDGDSGEDA
ncbi:MAG: AmmeMemoRadiSam system protein B [Bacteroidetes bacterium]|nr:AmmeMemoRadiSam system protein B [Bacteroidota bacterium]